MHHFKKRYRLKTHNLFQTSSYFTPRTLDIDSVILLILTEYGPAFTLVHLVLQIFRGERTAINLEIYLRGMHQSHSFTGSLNFLISLEEKSAFM